MGRDSRSLNKLIAIVVVAVALTFVGAGYLTAADTTYTTKVYTKQGGEELVIASGGTFHVESGGTVTLDTGSFCNPTSNLTLDDGTGASPSFILQDGSDETATFSKVDSAFLTLTTLAADGFQVLTGNFKVGNGTPGVAQDGEDAYIEGTLEVDGAVTLDGGLAGALTLSNSESVSNGTNGTITLGRNDAGTVTVTAADNDATAALTVLPGGAAAMTIGGASTTALTVTTDGTGTAEVALPAGSIDSTEVLDATLLPADDLYPGRGHFIICGDGVTVNNNTVYYGPIIGTVSSATVGQMSCDTTAAGNTTEATADTPAFTAQAFQVLGMRCVNQAAIALSISYTLRNNGAATVPSVTCTMGSNVRDCIANIQTTTAIASGNPVSIAVASGSDVTTDNFICEVDVAF